MRWLVRAVIIAIVRRILSRAALSALAIGLIVLCLASYAPRAHAQEVHCTSAAGCTVAEAQSECEGYQPVNPSIVRVTERDCRMSGAGLATTGNFWLRYKGMQDNGYETGWIGSETFWFVNQCASQLSKVTPFFPPTGSTRCVLGCEVTYRQNADDTTTYSPTGKSCDKKPDCAASGKNMVWNAALGVCQPVEPECPEGKVKVGNACADEKPCPDGMALVNGSCKKEDNECPAGMIRSPLGNCIPGDGQCAAGEVRGPDGTCKRDSNDDGEPDPQDKDDPETFSGGDECNAPPSCSGSPIMCGQARIQWRIECNTRRNNNISGGQCSQAGTPTCTGEKCNAMEYASLLMQWRSACAAEKLASKAAESGSGTSDSDKNANGVADALEGRGNVTAIGDNAADVSNAKSWGIPLSTDRLDTSNMFGGGGTCPEPPAITIMGKTVSPSEFPYFCRIAAIFRALILIFGAYTAIRILMGAFF